jgi:hypothetical protein
MEESFAPAMNAKKGRAQWQSCWLKHLLLKTNHES